MVLAKDLKIHCNELTELSGHNSVHVPVRARYLPSSGAFISELTKGLRVLVWSLDRPQVSLHTEQRER